jgi:hypothetical protein
MFCWAKFKPILHLPKCSTKKCLELQNVYRTFIVICVICEICGLKQQVRQVEPAWIIQPQFEYGFL